MSVIKVSRLYVVRLSCEAGVRSFIITREAGVRSFIITFFMLCFLNYGATLKTRTGWWAVSRDLAEKLGSGLSLLGSWGQVFHYYILVAVLFGLWEPS